MFIKNKYYNWYYNIIDSASQRSITGYTETHHIIPRSMGGSNNKCNLVKLTAREHYICHLLLTKITTGKNKSKMVYALHRITNKKDSVKIKSSKIYEYLRVEHSKIVSERHTGKTTKNAGKTHEEIFGKERSAEIKSNIRKSNSERTWTEKSKLKMSKSQKQRYTNNPDLLSKCPFTEKHKQNISESRKQLFRNKNTIVRNWHHVTHGTFVGTNYELADKYNTLKVSELNKVCNPEYNEKSHYGWKLTCP